VPTDTEPADTEPAEAEPAETEPAEAEPERLRGGRVLHRLRPRRAALEIRVPIDNFTFKPDVITVPMGTRIEWQNDDDIPHSIVETQGKFHSPALDTEDKYAFTFVAAGTFDYFCGLHPHMTGKVIVTP
jgi:plastocyanin